FHVLKGLLRAGVPALLGVRGASGAAAPVVASAGILERDPAAGTVEQLPRLFSAAQSKDSTIVRQEPGCEPTVRVPKPASHHPAARWHRSNALRQRLQFR